MKPWKMSRKERSGFLKAGPEMREAFNGLECQHRLPADIHRDVETAIALARKFSQEVLRPVYLERELKHMEDHEFLSWDILRKAGEWRLYSLFIPKLFGGKGLSFLGLYPFIEEIASVCSGLGHIIFVHYLGIATLFPSFNARLINRILRDVVKSEKEGSPRLLDLVITEPDAGTDVQEPLLFSKARISTDIKKVEGGYCLNGRKIFISNGHLSYWHIVMFFEDKKKGAQNFIQLVVPNGSHGFSFGSKERKMGNLGSTASELIFDDCFVPDKMVTLSSSDPAIARSRKGARWIIHTVVDYVVSSSRAGVGAIATGVCRSAYERALEHCRQKRVCGDLLINHQWAQIMLTDMYRNTAMARTLYMESAFTNMLSGLFKLLAKKPIHAFLRIMPVWYFALLSPLLNLKMATWIFRKYYYDSYTDEERNISSGWASIAKYTCSDLGLANANLALDLMGAEGLRHDRGAEKCFRDVKLQQIYESTNQINQMNAFYCLVGSRAAEAEYFK